jgi:hypothetical protein
VGPANPGCRRLSAGDRRPRSFAPGPRKLPERRLRSRLPAPRQMGSRHFSNTVFLAALLLASSAIDTLRADHLGCYGYRTNISPSIDRIAHEGIQFQSAFTPAPLTLPAHASLLTGLLHDQARLPRKNGSENLKPNLSSCSSIFTTCMGRFQLPKPWRDQYRGRLYDGEIAFVDSLIGKLWSALGNQTILVITADHGESLGDHGERNHGFFVYHSTTRVQADRCCANPPGGQWPSSHASRGRIESPRLNRQGLKAQPRRLFRDRLSVSALS